MQLGELSGADLVSKIRAACGDERRLAAEIVAYLLEIDRRKLYLEVASSSLYNFCVDKLGMSEGVTYRRINAVRLVRKFPALLPRIARGELHLSGLVLLRRLATGRTPPVPEVRRPRPVAPRNRLVAGELVPWS